jgi:hypothetical protein
VAYKKLNTHDGLISKVNANEDEGEGFENGIFTCLYLESWEIDIFFLSFSLCVEMDAFYEIAGR